MDTRAAVMRWVAAGLVVAFAVTACGNIGNGPQAGGEVVDGTGGELALPVTATYGYLDITVNGLETTDENPEGGTTPDPETYVGVEVSVANPTDVTSFELPPELFMLEGGGDPVRGTTADGEWLRVEPESTTAETLWFVLPESAELADPRLVVNESGYEPLTIPLTGSATATEQVPVAMDDDFEFVCVLVDFGDGVASFNASVTEGGSRRPAPNVSKVGRAAEGQVLVTFDVIFTERCTGLGSFYSMRGGAHPVLNEVTVGSQGISTEGNTGQPDDGSVTGYLAAAVPAEATEPMVFEWWDYEKETAVTTSVPLDAIAELTAT